VSDPQIIKYCHKCGYPQTFFESTWEKMEWANGKRFPTRHKGCGGEFAAKVARLGRSSERRAS